MTRYIKKLINILMTSTILLKNKNPVNYLSNNIAKK